MRKKGLITYFVIFLLIFHYSAMSFNFNSFSSTDERSYEITISSFSEQTLKFSVDSTDDNELLNAKSEQLDTRFRGSEQFNIMPTSYTPSTPDYGDSWLLGGGSSDIPHNVINDSSGNIYVVGETQSTDLDTLNADDSTFGGGSDGFVAKYYQNGSAQWVTYLGGSSTDIATDVEIIGSNVVVYGYTDSSDFPTTSGAYDTTLDGTDTFISIFNSTGSLTYSTFFGGLDTDFANGIASDSSGNILITGYTRSNQFQGFPLVNAYNGTMGGFQDAFVAKLNSAADTVIFSTYLGGDNGGDNGRDIAIDSSDNVFVVGETNSNNFPTSNGAYTTKNGTYDAFVTKFTSTGSLTWSTFLGGTDYEVPRGVTTDENDHIYLTGRTDSVDFPLVDAIDTTHEGSYEAFVTRFNNTGEIDFSTYLGGVSNDIGHNINSRPGFIYVTGETSSSDYPLINSFDETIDANEAFISRLSLDGSSLEWSAVIGGGLSEVGHGLSFSQDGRIILTGQTSSSDFPLLLPGQTKDAGRDIFISLLKQGVNTTAPQNLRAKSLVGQNFLSWSAPADNGGFEVDYYQISRTTTSGSSYTTLDTTTDRFYMDTTAVPGTTYYYVVTAFNEVGESPASTEEQATPLLEFSDPVDELPVTLFIGGISGDGGELNMVKDSGGNYIISFVTGSVDLPVLNPYQAYLNGSTDKYIAKLTPNGTLIWSTYFGGSSSDGEFESGYQQTYGGDIAIDKDDNIVITGTTVSDNIPLKNAYDTDRGEVSFDNQDAYVAKFNNDGTLNFSTYLGGGDDDLGKAISVDNLGNVVVGGYAKSLNFPTTSGVLYESGSFTGFITKFDASGNLVWSTYYEENSNPVDIHDMAVDSSDNIYVVGNSGDIRTSKISSDGTSVVWTQSRGGTGTSLVSELVLDSSDNPIIVGTTYASDFPMSTGIQTSFSGQTDMVFFKYTNETGAIEISSYFGGNSFDVGRSVALDENENIIIVGDTSYSSSNDFPHINANNGTFGESYEAIVANISSTGNTLYASTYLGARGSDYGYKAYYADNGNVLALGQTNSAPFPGNLTNNIGSTDVYVSKIRLGSSPTPPTLSSSDGEGYINLSWNTVDEGGNSPLTNYTIYRSSSSGGSYSQLTSLQTTVFEYNDTGIPKDTTYYYVITASNQFFGEGDQSSEVVGTSLGVPDAPQNFVATNQTSSVDLSWEEPSNTGGLAIDMYHIYRSGTSGGPYTLEYSVSGSTFSLTDSNVNQGELYYYVVVAENGIGNSSQSSEVLGAPGAPPSTPSQPTITAGDTTVIVNWTAPSTDNGYPITEYRIYRSTSSSGPYTFIGTNDTAFGFYDTGLTNGQTYYYQVSAVNDKGESNLSPYNSAYPTGLPSEPTNVVATPGDSEVLLEWDPPLDDGGLAINYYHIYYSPDGSLFLKYTQISGSTTSITVTGLTNGEEYTFFIIAENSNGEGGDSEFVNATPYGTPGEVTDIVISTGDQRATLNWTAPTDDGGRPITEYRIYRSTSPSTGYSFVGTNNTETGFDDFGLTNGVTYYYKISAVNLAGEGSLSTEVSGIASTIPDSPSNLSTTVSDQSITISWDEPFDGGDTITEYRIYRTQTSGSGYLLVSTTTTLSFTDTGLTNGETYYYVVTAVNSNGESGNSAEVSGVPASVPGTPTNIEIETGVTYVIINWTAPVDDGGYPITHYNIYRADISGGSYSLVGNNDSLTGFIDYSIIGGNDYFYTITAVNSQGESIQSTEVSANVPGISDAPQNVSTISGNWSILISWDQPAFDGYSTITGYNVYRSTTSGSGYILIDTVDMLSYNDTSVELGNTYYYLVSAINEAGESATSSEVSAVPSAVPSPPLNLLAIDDGDAVALTWDPPQNDYGSQIVEYNLYRRGGEGWIFIASTTDLSYRDTSIELDVAYEYHVRALNGIGESDMSNIAKITIQSDDNTTPPDTPDDSDTPQDSPSDTDGGFLTLPSMLIIAFTGLSAMVIVRRRT